MTRRDFTRNLAAWAALAALRGPARAAASLPSRITAVDTHAHIFERGLKLAPVHRYVPDYDATLENYLGRLDSHGISHGVLVQPSFLGTDNSYLVSGLKKASGRLRGIAVVEPSISAADLEELALSGVVGIRLNLIGETTPEVTGGPWPSLLATLRKRGWQVEIQQEARSLEKIVGPLLAAGMNVVIDHFGRPDPKLGVKDPGFQYLLGTASTRRVWVKLSGAYRNGPDGAGESVAMAAAPLLRSAFGPDRLLWGSDWPHTQFEKVATYSAVRAELDQWIPDPSERTTILRDTPAKLYRFGAA